MRYAAIKFQAMTSINLYNLKLNRQFRHGHLHLYTALLVLLLSSCATQKQQLIFRYNGAIIHLPQEIDCATKGDTLYIINTKRLGKNSREIEIGYRVNSQP